jgi:hypothetical protein
MSSYDETLVTQIHSFWIYDLLDGNLLLSSKFFMIFKTIFVTAICLDIVHIYIHNY